MVQNWEENLDFFKKIKTALLSFSIYSKKCPNFRSIGFKCPVLIFVDLIFFVKKGSYCGLYRFCGKKHALARVPLDASRWTPKGETNGLNTLYVQKAYEFDVGDTVSVFCGRRVKISIIHNYNLSENFGGVSKCIKVIKVY